MNSILETPIYTIEDAKNYFVAYGCSHFHMGRASDARYQEYRKMEIPKSVEESWRHEQFNLTCTKLVYDSTPAQMFYRFHLLVQIAQMLKDLNCYAKVLAVLNEILPKMDVQDYILFAKILMGTTDIFLHRGFIYDVYELSPKLANAFMKIVAFFLEKGNQKDDERAENTARYQEILGYITQKTGGLIL